MHRKRVTLVFACNCCNLELCLTQLLRNTVDNLAWRPPGPSGFKLHGLLLGIAYCQQLELLAFLHPRDWKMQAPIKRLLLELANSCMAYMNGTDGFHVPKAWIEMPKHLRNHCFSWLFLNCLNILLEDVMWLALISKLTDEPRPGTPIMRVQECTNIRNMCVKIPMYCILNHIYIYT